jgi:excisionase family DNA binding protein
MPNYEDSRMQTAIESKLDRVLERLEQLRERPEASPERYLTVDGAADYAAVSAESIRRLLAAGRLTALRPVGGRVVIDRREIDSYMQSTADTRPARGQRH